MWVNEYFPSYQLKLKLHPILSLYLYYLFMVLLSPLNEKNDRSSAFDLWCGPESLMSVGVGTVTLMTTDDR